MTATGTAQVSFSGGRSTPPTIEGVLEYATSPTTLAGRIQKLVYNRPEMEPRENLP